VGTLDFQTVNFDNFLEPDKKTSFSRNEGFLSNATNWQAGQTCTGSLIFANLPPVTFAQIACWGKHPQTPFSSSSMLATRSF